MLRRAVSCVVPRTALAAASASARSLSTTPVARAPAEKFTDPDMIHFRHTATAHPLYQKTDASASAAAGQKAGEEAGEWQNPMSNAVWTEKEALGVEQTHRPPEDIVDKIALTGIKFLRGAFDVVSGYAFGRLTPNKILRRIVFLETAAGIPGMVAGTLRHLMSLRRMQRDHGWIHTLLEEAENERMHMLVFMKHYKPNAAFRGLVLLTQGIFWNVFFVCYLACPRLCHRFVGYLEEEAVRTYTHILEVVKSTDPADQAIVDWGNSPASGVAKRYWNLKTDATMYDVLLAVRADEANHRDVNHTFASLKQDDRNPFVEHKAGSAAEFMAQQQQQQK